MGKSTISETKTPFLLWIVDDKDQNTILIQTVVEIDPESPLDAVNAYREETAEDVDIYTLAWRGRRFTEEDEEELA